MNSHADQRPYASRQERARRRFYMAFLGMYPVGGLAAGALASWIGATHTLALGGVCCMLCALWLARRLPGLRQEMRPIYERLGLLRQWPETRD